ncbi:hypothetical protein HPP92_025087 [Vanilla planifolia]|nr:hypothetical protein HPP92_025087 [Vanilla planifolia]
MAMKGCLEGSAADMKCDDPFDSIDDLLDFPCDEDVLAMVNDCGNDGPFASPPAPAAIFSGSGSGETVGGGETVAAGEMNSKEETLGLCDDLDIINLEWLSNFFDDDSEFNFNFPATAALAANMNADNKDDPLFGSLSPTSVLEHDNIIGGGGASSSASSCSSSTSASGGGRIVPRLPTPTTTSTLPVPARARTKRPRPQFFSTRIFVPTPTRPTEPESFGESCPDPTRKRKKKKKTAVAGESDDDNPPPAAPRKCTHCEIQKTPQWRAGPMGPKSLCNACGVRYKSGRLFPEYRPAASPTFVPSIHSNSHKKVVEMRLRASQDAADEMLPPEGTAAAKSCDLMEYIRMRD